MLRNANKHTKEAYKLDHREGTNAAECTVKENRRPECGKSRVRGQESVEDGV